MSGSFNLNGEANRASLAGAYYPRAQQAPASRGAVFDFFAGTEARATITTYVVVLAIGLGLGFGLPTPLICATFTNQAWNLASAVTGWVYFSAWSVSFWPQIFVNWHRKSVVGLSFDYAVLNLLGFSCYAAYNVALFYNPTVRAQYAAQHKGSLPGVKINDVFFSLHAAIVTLLLIIQICIYERGGQRVSNLCWAILAVLILAVLVAAAVTAAGVDPSWLDWNRYLLFVSYVKLTISIMKYVPQVFLNWRRKSTVGWNIYNVFLDFTGGALSVGQLILDCEISGDWSQLSGDPVKFFLGNISMFFDIIFFIQHYCLYPSTVGDDSGDSAPAHFLSTDDEYARLVVDTISDDAAPAKGTGGGKRTDLARYDYTGY